MSIDLTIQNAITFATHKHIDQKRKLSDTPYIVHPMEVMQILTAMGCEKNVIIAGILHDTLEDTDTTPEEIEKLFGNEVLSLVQAESEDKTKSWKERKQKTIDNLKTSSVEIRLVCLADKISNIKSLVNELKRKGEIDWSKFKASKQDTAWYYNSIYGTLKGSLPPNTYEAMEELREAIEFVFA